MTAPVAAAGCRCWWSRFSRSSQEPGRRERRKQSGDEPTANPGRPTVATPATLTPVGYLQFETGFLGAWHSPEFSSQSSLNEVMKFSLYALDRIVRRGGPFAHSTCRRPDRQWRGRRGSGSTRVVYQGEGARPDHCAELLPPVYGGDAPDLDIGSATKLMPCFWPAQT